MKKDYDHFVFTAVKIIAWIIFIGLCIESGGLIVNFILTIYNPDQILHLYYTVDLSELYAANTWAFYQVYSFILSISLLKTYLFYIVILLVTKMDLSKPFNQFVSDKITTISYYTFVVGILSFIARRSSKKMEIKGLNVYNADEFWVDAQAFVLMAAVIYIIAIIFKRGIALQTENDLTV